MEYRFKYVRYTLWRCLVVVTPRQKRKIAMRQNWLRQNCSTNLALMNRLGCWLVVVTAILTFCCNTIVRADDPGFTEDAKEAIARAVEQDKDIIFLFTGSDWCPPCKRLEKEVLSEKDFLFEVSKHFVLVKLDFPKMTEQDPGIAKQNQEYQGKFGIGAFPTLVLTDSLLKPFAFAGYEAGGFRNYLGMLEKAREMRVGRDENLKAAKGKKGAERAKLLDQAIGEMGEEIVKVYYPEIIAEIVELDKDNSLKLREKWNASEDAEMRKVVMTDLLMVARLEKPKLAISFIDEVLEEVDFNDAEKLEIFLMKLNLVRQLKDDKMTDELLDQMINLEGVQGETRQRLIVKKIYLMIGSGRRAEALKTLDQAIADGGGSIYLFLAKGELHDAKAEYKEAIEAYDGALKTARSKPDVMIELVSAKADALYELKDEKTALQILDDFADDTQMPSDLRAESLLHKAMIMRDMKRTRQARLAENRAIEITESAQERAEIQNVVDKLRIKFGEQAISE